MLLIQLIYAYVCGYRIKKSFAFITL
jgi:hypothetical protein